MKKTVIITTLPYDTLIKKEKSSYAEKHRGFLDSYIINLIGKGFKSDEIAKIIGRSEGFVKGRMEDIGKAD